MITKNPMQYVSTLIIHNSKKRTPRHLLLSVGKHHGELRFLSCIYNRTSINSALHSYISPQHSEYAHSDSADH